MKFSCDMIRDLMPLYCDKVCSKVSEDAVEEHLAECGECRRIYEEMTSADDSSELAEYENRQMKTMRNVRKKVKKKNSFLLVGGIVLGCISVIAVMYVCILSGLLYVTALTDGNSMVTVSTVKDASGYNECIGDNVNRGFKYRLDVDESIFPEKIGENMDVELFRFAYCNTLDVEYAACLDVNYNEEDFAAELERLRSKENDQYIGLYGVVGAPEGYEIVAMDSDEYYGFVYAMTPADGRTSVVYVMTAFCDYFMDAPVISEIPEKYLLKGMDVSVENEYRKERMKLIKK